MPISATVLGASFDCRSVTATVECGTLVQEGEETPFMPLWPATSLPILFAIIGHITPLQHAMQPVSPWHGTAARAGASESVASRMIVTNLAKYRISTP